MHADPGLAGAKRATILPTLGTGPGASSAPAIALPTGGFPDQRTIASWPPMLGGAGPRPSSPLSIYFNPLSFQQGTINMEAERINSIGNTLADLSRRTDDLRGYL